MEEKADEAANKDTMLMAWFKLNQNDEAARHYLYSDIPHPNTMCLRNTKDSGKLDKEVAIQQLVVCTLWVCLQTLKNIVCVFFYSMSMSNLL